MAAHILIVNPNRMRPPIAPVAVDLLGTVLEDAGFAVRVLDLAWAGSIEDEMARALRDPPLLVALTCRNIDDSSVASRAFCLEEHARVARLLREHSDAPIVAGGSGFSIAPRAAMEELGVELAVWGEGELALVELARALERRRPVEAVPGLLWREGGEVRANGPRALDLASAGAPRRTFVDNARYLREGAQVGFETSRGCGRACAYCADPLLKGKAVGTRDPESVADEIESLARSGVDVFHTCDSEFNADYRHALAVCASLGARGLGERVRWYAYLSPVPFTSELAREMRRAGCVGVNFGADHTEAGRLARLRRAHSLDDLRRARAWCGEHGISVMFDLLLGAPGETRGSVRAVLDAMRSFDPEAVGVALGLRLYRGTALGDELAPRGGPAARGVTGATDELLRPAFFLEPMLGKDAAAWLASEIAGDARFLFFGGAGEGGEGAAAAPGSAPGRTEGAVNYNYNANEALGRAIAGGARGAYWDILRRPDAGGQGSQPADGPADGRPGPRDGSPV